MNDSVTSDPASDAPARRGPRPALRLAFLVLVLAACLGLAVLVGAAPIAPGRVLAALGGGGDPAARGIVLGLRLPRAVQGALVGGGLAVAGAAFQALLRNPLAEPYVLGVSGGAALGAVAALVLGWSAAGVWSLPVAAFCGALLAVGAVLAVAARSSLALDTRVLLLAGVVAGAFFNALIMLLLSLGRAEAFRSAIYWMMGSLSGAGWSETWILALYVLPSSAVLLALARPLNLLAVGEETALYLGTKVEGTKRIVYVATSLLVAATVSVAGAIGFVGLIVPHAVRLAWGSDHRLLMPASLLAGGAFLVLADTAARTVAAPAELPVGVVTALVGVPLFVTLLVRESGRGGGLG
ncbi:MAG TPA: iron ABC transporter permease [Gemmatimonadota bacterium]|nr:iron ABC transporter permease [Gemmatimonadota bacterium]